MGLLPFRLFAGLRGQVDRPLAVAKGVVGRRGQEPGEIVEHAVVVVVEGERGFQVGERRFVVADRNQGVAAAAAAQKLLVFKLEGPRESLDCLARLLGREIEHAELAHEQGVVAMLRHELAKIADRSGIVVALGGDQTAQLEGGGMVGPAAEHAFEVGLGLLRVASLLVDAGSEHERDRVVGIELDRLVEIGDRLGLLPLEGEHAGPLEQGAGGVGIDIDRLVECLLRLVELVLHHVGHAKGLVQRDVVGVFLDRHGEVGPGVVELVVEQAKQAAGAAHVFIARGEFHRLVVVGLPGGLVVVAEVAADHVGLGDQELVFTAEIDRLVGRLVGPLAVAAGQALEPRDHQPGRPEGRVAIDGFVEIAHGEVAHPLPLGIGIRAVEDRLHDHARPVHERACVEIGGKLLALFVEPLLDGRLAELEHGAKVIEVGRGQLRVDGGIEIGLAGLIGRSRGTARQREGKQEQQQATAHHKSPRDAQ